MFYIFQELNNLKNKTVRGKFLKIDIPKDQPNELYLNYKNLKLKDFKTISSLGKGTSAEVDLVITNENKIYALKHINDIELAKNEIKVFKIIKRD